MSQATAALDAMIASVRRMGTLVPDAMPALTKALRAESERTIAAGTTAYGEKWALTQEGEQPLQHAVNALRVMSVNTTIYITISGPEARHHLGYVRGGRQRAILPIGKLPDSMANAMRSVLEQAFRNAVKP